MRIRFLPIWMLACFGCALVIVAFNALIDPYLVFGTPRIGGVNLLKPAVETQERLMKPYDVIRRAPNTVILGSSIVDLGIDAGHAAWPSYARPVYNGALAGGGPYSAYRYLQHIMSYHPPALVVLGVDFEFFIDSPDFIPITAAFEERLAVTASGERNAGRLQQYAIDILRASVSLDAVKDSFSTITANLSGRSSTLSAGNWESIVPYNLAAALGAHVLVRDTNVANIQRFYRKRMNPRAMESVRAILKLCKDHSTQVTIFINPMQAEALELWDLLGYWRTFENWKRELLSVTNEHAGSDARQSIVLWDFSGYDELYSSEGVPTDRSAMRFFWDAIHYRRTLGEVIVARMFGNDDVPFGVVLTSGNIESHLANIREQQRLYRLRHGDEAREVKDLYDAVVVTISGK